MKIVFVRTRYEYASYRDYWSLVELAGFETCFTEQMDLREDAFYIVSAINRDFYPHIDHCRFIGGEKRAIVAWWNLERPDYPGFDPLSTIISDVLRFVDITWTSDRHYSALDPRQLMVVMGSDTRLIWGGATGANFERLPIQYDYTHQSFVYGRREATFINLRDSAGLREGPNGWYAERDATLKSSRMIVNIHQTPAPVGEPIRFAMAAAYHLPMVSETLADPYPLVPGVDYIEAPLERVGEEVRRAVSMDLSAIGESLFQRLCVEWSFRRGVEEGVAESIRRLGC